LQVSYIALVISVMLASFQGLAEAQGKERPVKYPTFYRTIQIDELSIFYPKKFAYTFDHCAGIMSRLLAA